MWGKWRGEIVVCLLLLFTTLFIYWQTVDFDFIRLDDRDFVLDNLYVSDGLSHRGLNYAFTAPRQGNYIPLVWVSYMIDAELHGVDPGAFHLTNVLLHATAALLLFLTLRLMTGSVWRSGAVAALFAIHPAHVESVAWVAERKDTLSAVFWMLCMLAYAAYVRRPDARKYNLLAIVFILGLMAKSMLVTLPFVLLLLDYWPLRRLAPGNGSRFAKASLPRLLREKIPLFIIAAAFCIVTLWAQRAGGAVSSLAEIPLGIRLSNAVVSCVAYLGKLVWPAHLAVIYPHPGSSLPVWQAAASGCLIVAFSWLAIRARRTRPYLPVGWLWYLITLVPVIGIVQVGYQAMADRYTYIPSIGLFVAVVWGLGAVVSSARAKMEGKHLTLIPPTSAISVAVLILCALTIQARFQTSRWVDTLTLLTHATAATRDNTEAHMMLGHELAWIGRTDEALVQYKKVLRIDPGDFKAHLGIGMVHSKEDRHDAAMKSYLNALRIRPNLPVAHANMAVGFIQQGRVREAIREYKSAVELDPADPAIRESLARAYLLVEDVAGAKREARECRRLGGTLPPELSNLLSR
ncbi:MAG: tetratricopeptide repeat protein [Armatimonadota bacterium]|nr:tetratricopeptide repeat protein [Armatimonadota bacterium]